MAREGPYWRKLATSRLQLAPTHGADEREAEQVAGSGRPHHTSASTHEAGMPVDPNVLPSGAGVGLPSSLRRELEGRFDQDFSQVRIHDGPEAAASAHALRANAFTHDRDIVFARGQFAPHSVEGRHRLVHELTHVVQQRDRAQPTIHRQADGGATPPAAVVGRVDITVASGADMEAYARGESAVAPVQVDSLAALIAALTSHGAPIRRLEIYAHGSQTSIKLGSTSVMLTELASALAAAFPGGGGPEVIDFRGCSVGANPEAMNEIRAAAGARTMRAANAFVWRDSSESVEIGGRAITRPDQVTAANRAEFETKLQALAHSYSAADLAGGTVDIEKCIVNPGEAGYFKAGGHLVVSAMIGDFGVRCLADIPVRSMSPERAAEGLYMSNRREIVEVGER